jgi:hypothetical protein
LNADGTWAWPDPVEIDAYTSYSFSFGESACAEENCLVTFSETFEPLDFVIVDGSGVELVGRTPLPDLWDEYAAPSIRFDPDGQFWLTYVQDNEVSVRTLMASGGDVGAPGTDSYDDAAGVDVDLYGATWQAYGDDMLIVSNATVVDASTESGFRHIVEARTLTPGVGLDAPVTLVNDAPWGFRWVGGVGVGDELLGFHHGYSETREQLFRSRYDRTLGIVEDATPSFDESWFGLVDCVSGLLVYNRLDWDVGFGGDRVRLHWAGDRSWLGSDGAVCTDDGQCASGRCRGAVCCDDCPLWRGL